MSDEVTDLLAYIDASPSPFHAVLESKRRLEAAGFREVHERDAWQLAPGARAFVIRDGTVEWRPAIDVDRLLRGALATAAGLLALRLLVSRR